MPDEPVVRPDQVDIAELDSVAQARVVHYMRHALELMDEGQAAMTTALEYFEAAARTIAAPVNDALAGRVPLHDLTAEQRALFNRIVDETISERLAGSDYAAELLAEGVTVVYLDGDELIGKKQDGSTRKIR